jgi:hypothetical protein
MIVFWVNVSSSFRHGQCSTNDVPPHTSLSYNWFHHVEHFLSRTFLSSAHPPARTMPIDTPLRVQSPPHFDAQRLDFNPLRSSKPALALPQNHCTQPVH